MLYVISTLIGVLGAWIVGRFGGEFGLVDRPNHRSSHESPTPKGGGIGLLLAFIYVSFSTETPLSFWIPASCMGFLGLYTDRKNPSPQLRLLIHFLSAFIVSWSILYRTQSFSLPIIFMIPTAIFIVGTANFYNFMDGINGIAAITSIIGFGLLACFAMVSNTGSPLIPLAVPLFLACLGFLPFNFPKARVFMGDVGSILLGFVFAGMVLSLSHTFFDFICLSSFLFPFYADELTTMVIRIRAGEKLTQPHRRHLYQLLANEFGIAHWKISLAYGIAQLVIGVSVLALRPLGGMAVVLLLAAYFASFIVLTGIVRAKLLRMKV